MNQYLIAFITGITTGGLSCLAVQGGLLASSLARQLEQDMGVGFANPTQSKGNKSTSRRNGRQVKQIPHNKFRPRTALPIAIFLTAKVAAYTVLGFLLGVFGSVLTLNSTIRAILLIAIGIFMVGNALRMFNVHPIFRYFAIEPPKFITRYIRRTAKNGADLVAPLFLGALTVFIPCGVTQAMMAVAIATGSPIQGAGLLLAFTLGTSPVFFIVAYLTTQIGGRLEKLFMRFVGVVILVLGLFSIVSGMNLAGIPVPGAGLVENVFAAKPADQPIHNVFPTAVTNTVLTLNAQNNGYFPAVLYAQANAPVKLNIVTQNTRSCAVDFVIPALGVETLLPNTGTTPINIPPQQPGSTIRFTCSMGMFTGKIVFK
jgi:sulfite exporter TauE/SafE